MKTKKKESSFRGVFPPTLDMKEFLEQRGDLRAVLDHVHGHFFNALTWAEMEKKPPLKISDRKHHKKGDDSHAESNFRERNRGSSDQ
jgi:hypothetical protein